MKYLVSIKATRVFCLLSLAFGLLATTACTDSFFETDPDSVLNDEDYISQENEMARGFLGLITAVQNVADNAIWMTDPRCQYLEITSNAPIALQNIYNYVDTDGNEYADPTGYYNIIIQCNDFINKMDQFHQRAKGAMSNTAKVDFNNMLSSAMRVKMWAYLQLISNYGEAYWWENAVSEVTSFNDANDYSFKKGNMKELLDKCIDQLDNGFTVDGVYIAPNLSMDWNYWIDPSNGSGYMAARDASGNVYADAVPYSAGTYGYWKYMVPPAEILLGELLSWRADCYGTGDAQASRSDWKRVRDVILQFMWDAKYYSSNSGSFTNLTDGQSGNICMYVMGAQMPLIYSSIFYYERPSVRNEAQLIMAAFYDYDNKQTNRLVQYFCPAYPGDGYYLRPSAYGQSLYNEADIRNTTQKICSNYINGQEALTKFYYFRDQGYLRNKIFEIEPAIILFRGVDLYYLLAEAENHLGHWEVADAIFNNGFMQKFPTSWTQLYDRLHETDSFGDIVWDYRYLRFHGSDLNASSSYNGYPNAPESEKYTMVGHQGNTGLMGSIRASIYDFDPSTNPDLSGSEAERMKITDLYIATEYIKEMQGEGKSYGMLAKMAQRWDDTQTFMIDVIKGNHTGHESDVQQQLSNNRFINWTLKTE